MVLATLLQMPRVRNPLRWLSRNAPRVSAVSPLWLIAKTSVLPLIGVLRWRNSLAYSTSTGMLASCSMRYSPTSAACNAVPQPVSTTRETSRNSAARTNHELFDVGMNERDAVGTNHLFKRGTRGIDQASFGIGAVNLLINAADQMRQHFSIGVRGKLVATFALELFAQRRVIFNHA